MTYLAGTECSQGNRDTGRSKTGCPVPAPRRALWDPEPRPGAGWACASLSVREAPKPDLPLSQRCRENPGPACPWVGRTDSGTGAELCSAARWGHPAQDGGGGGREGKVLCLRDGASRCVAAPGLRHLLSGTPSQSGIPSPRTTGLAEQGDSPFGRHRPARTVVRPPCPPGLGLSEDTCAFPVGTRILELGLVL